MAPPGQTISDPPRVKREDNILRMVRATVAVGGSNKKARAIAGAGLDSGVEKFIPADNKSVLSDPSTDSTVQQPSCAPVTEESDAISGLSNDGSCHVEGTLEDRGNGNKETDDRDWNRSYQESAVCSRAGGVRTRPVDRGDLGYAIACNNYLGPTLYYQAVGFDAEMSKVQLVGIKGSMIVVPFAEICVLNISQNIQMFGSWLVMKNERLR